MRFWRLWLYQSPTLVAAYWRGLAPELKSLMKDLTLKAWARPNTTPERAEPVASVAVMSVLPS